ncbi:hypothetical protein ACFQY4_37740 [Catellatospora bangladeshensis]|uniref:hypothetical protein n=1 Tax=Catellatospora bangladeshensis TaxID=310355 RepID=UPI003605FC0E
MARTGSGAANSTAAPSRVSGDHFGAPWRPCFGSTPISTRPPARTRTWRASQSTVARWRTRPEQRQLRSRKPTIEEWPWIWPNGTKPPSA